MLKMCRFQVQRRVQRIIHRLMPRALPPCELGADRVFMGYLSELGPVDPQIQNILPTGQTQMIPARAYIRGLENIRDRVVKGELNNPLCPNSCSDQALEMIAFCEEAIEFSKDFLRRWLPVGSLKEARLTLRRSFLS